MRSTVEEMGSKCGFGPEEGRVSVAKSKDLVPLLTPIVVNGETCADAQVLVDAEIVQWQHVWGGPMCNLVVEQPFSESLPRSDVADVRKAIATFPRITAVGCDVWERWTWKHLSDRVRYTFIQIAKKLIQKHFHPKTLSSKNTFTKNGFIQ